MGNDAGWIGANQAVGSLMRCFGAKNDIIVRRDADWRGTLISDLRSAGLETRIFKVGKDYLNTLIPPIVLIGGNREWIFLSDAVLSVPDDWGGFEGLEALEVIDRVPASTVGLMRRVLAGVSFRGELAKRAIVCGVAASALSVVAPQAARVALGTAIPQGAIGWLAFSVFAVFATSVIGIIVEWLKQNVGMATEAMVMSGVQRGVIGHYLRAPFASVMNRPASEAMILRNGYTIGVQMIRFVSEIISGGLSALVNSAIMLWTMPLLGGLFIGLGLTFFLAMMLVGKVQAKAKGIWKTASLAQYGRLNELLSGIAALKACGSIGVAMREWAHLLDAEVQAGRSVARIAATANIISSSTNRATWAAVLIVGGYAAMRGDMNAGSLVAFVMMASGILASFVSLSNTWLRLLAEREVVRKIDDILAIEPMVRGRREMTYGPIVMKSVWFRYTKDGSWIVRDFNMEVAAGGVVWLRSPSGSGKTTLLRLMSGLLRPERGHVLIGGYPAYGTNMAIGYLPQEARLHDGSIMDNLLGFSGQAPHDRILRMATATGLDRLVADLPMGYRTRATSGTFSGGQRQLMAITGVLAMDCGILMLDEPMANMDWSMKAMVSEAIRTSGKTIIYVSHDIPVTKPDKVVDLRFGEAVRRGEPEDD
jgi:ABC-type bacteriocin/lantibiotic exporter with double-glycine peptidase domain